MEDNYTKDKISLKEGERTVLGKINEILNKMSTGQLERVYKFVKYIYIHG